MIFLRLDTVSTGISTLPKVTFQIEYHSFSEKMEKVKNAINKEIMFYLLAGLYCPFAYRLPDQAVLAKDLAAEYHYLGNTSEWFFLARQNAEKVINKNEQYIKGWTSKRRHAHFYFNQK